MTKREFLLLAQLRGADDTTEIRVETAGGHCVAITDMDVAPAVVEGGKSAIILVPCVRLKSAHRVTNER
jgi:hypothetical protein